ncbi:hypothetical protein TRFO_24863 [Tritrichomonas foetus]|uniref:Glycosyltransferase 2-like domain-containing protein n=1 Tax=Tritrichomonas foetus TaxID=1144522 RepID=A0A1J4KBB6_9EUKA|nr:hypothetical protein TRFO_24863 [Tritrichomonas foetus]|eukprot:OHT06980.1 hypothetical protein TRFO_24863 [Tritrichomonas foetus]
MKKKRHYDYHFILNNKGRHQKVKGGFYLLYFLKYSRYSYLIHYLDVFLLLLIMRKQYQNLPKHDHIYKNYQASKTDQPISFVNDFENIYKISIIVPIFNKEHILKRLFKNLLNQTYSDYEIVFIDDGSTDQSYEILVNQTKKDKRITIIRHFTNMGTYRARRNGFLYSSGEFVIGVDPDDEIEHEGISLLMNELNKTKRFPKHHLPQQIKISKTNENNPIFSSQKDKIDYADIYEYQFDLYSSGFMISPNHWKCFKNMTHTKEIVQNYALQKKGYVSNNLWKRMIRRSIAVEAVKITDLIIPNKRFTWAEDMLITASVFSLSKYLICSNLNIYHYNFVNRELGMTPREKEANDNHLIIANNFRNFVYEFKNIRELLKNQKYTEIRDSFYNTSTKGGKENLRALSHLEDISFYKGYFDSPILNSKIFVGRSVYIIPKENLFIIKWI